jgi:hypothetical protein
LQLVLQPFSFLYVPFYNRTETAKMSIDFTLRSVKT